MKTTLPSLLLKPLLAATLIAVLTSAAFTAAANASGLPSASVEADIAINTFTGSFTLTAPGSLLSGASVKGAGRVAELAAAAVLKDAADLAREEEVLNNDVTTLEARRVEVRQEWAEICASYENRLSVYQQQAASYDAEVREQLSAAAASNALLPEQRNEATVEWLNEWKRRLDSQHSDLDRLAESVEQERIAAVEYEDSAIRDDAAAYEQLVLRSQDLEARLGEAYRQLLQCHEYAVQIGLLVQDDSRVERSAIPRKTWFETEELLKELSNRGFDGNTPQPQLID